MVARRDSETYVTWLAINGKGHELSSYILKLNGQFCAVLVSVY